MLPEPFRMPRAMPWAIALPIASNLLPPLPTALHSAESAPLPRLWAALDTWLCCPLIPARILCTKTLPMDCPLLWDNSAFAALCAPLAVRVAALERPGLAFRIASRMPSMKALPTLPPASAVRIAAAASSAAVATVSTAALTVSLLPVIPVAISVTAAS